MGKSSGLPDLEQPKLQNKTNVIKSGNGKILIIFLIGYTEADMGGRLRP
ncbi:MAG: hypothetical protein LBJ00_00565 [Planctomycetaceae bacterium]|nr:hypothetical protein [Planctomycetaceae bacterium]